MQRPGPAAALPGAAAPPRRALLVQGLHSRPRGLVREVRVPSLLQAEHALLALGLVLGAGGVDTNQVNEELRGVVVRGAGEA